MMKKYITHLTSDTKHAVGWMALSVFMVSLLVSVLLIIGIVAGFMYLSGSSPDEYANTISVSGETEVVAVPDVATFTFSVTETAETVDAAQSQASRDANAALAVLKKMDVEEEDIKTTSYNVHPKYEWLPQEDCLDKRHCPNERVLIGYEVSQTVRVKVRETENAGKILAGIGNKGVDSVSGLNFEVDDMEELREDARAQAIRDAKAKAKKLSRELGVSLGKIVSYTDGGNDYYPEPMYGRAMMMDVAVSEKAIAPQLPVGEETSTVRVNITYELK